MASGNSAVTDGYDNDPAATRAGRSRARLGTWVSAINKSLTDSFCGHHIGFVELLGMVHEQKIDLLDVKLGFEERQALLSRAHNDFDFVFWKNHKTTRVLTHDFLHTHHRMSK